MLTDSEVIALIRKGKKIMCNTPEECMECLEYFIGIGFSIFPGSQYHLDPSSLRYKESNCLWPGLFEDNIICCYNGNRYGTIEDGIPFDEIPVSSNNIAVDADELFAALFE